MMKADNYEDIIFLSRPVSEKHPPMPLHDRAAQFAPFAALTGYDAAISETARLTDHRIEPDEDTARQLDEQLSRIRECLAERPAVEITHFIPDAHKQGGKYVTVSGNVRRVDTYTGELVLTDRRRIPLADILRVTLTHTQPKNG